MVKKFEKLYPHDLILEEKNLFILDVTLVETKNLRKFPEEYGESVTALGGTPRDLA